VGASERVAVAPERVAVVVAVAVAVAVAPERVAVAVESYVQDMVLVVCKALAVAVDNESSIEIDFGCVELDDFLRFHRQPR